MKILLMLLGGALSLIAMVIAGLFLWARFSDGPIGPIAGGAFETGEFADAASVDWKAVLGDQPVVEIELQLESTASSRTTGAFVYEGTLYVPCDLGYVWRRVPNGTTRLVLHTMWLFKDWHIKAVEDGRVIVRTQGSRYKLQATRVTDEALLSIFRKHVSTAAAGAFELRPVQTNPNDIWFFRLTPRDREKT